MSYTIERVQKGIAQYLDSEVVPKLKKNQGTLPSFAVAAYTSLVLANLPNTIKSLTSHPLVAFAGVIDDEENIDADSIIDQLDKAMPAEGLKINLPVVGGLTFYKEDLLLLRQMLQMEE